jgi:hypothetical protein
MTLFLKKNTRVNFSDSALRAYLKFEFSAWILMAAKNSPFGDY